MFVIMQAYENQLLSYSFFFFRFLRVSAKAHKMNIYKQNEMDNQRYNRSLSLQSLPPRGSQLSRDNSIKALYTPELFSFFYRL